MEAKGVTIVFHKEMKMSELIDENYHLLLLLDHLNINLGFGEKSVEKVCLEHHFDADCFIFLANYLSKRIINTEEMFDELPLEPFLYYLECAHSYFLDRRLPNIRRKLIAVFADSDPNLQQIVLNFFDLYSEEVHDHMKYEDEVVFPYINRLTSRSGELDYSIDMFEERHNDIEGKVSDLKQILMKYIDKPKDRALMVNILMELYMSEEELEVHTYIEDYLVIPKVKALETNRRYADKL